jgi:tetratricopeptide (TPR) repeat protein
MSHIAGAMSVRRAGWPGIAAPRWVALCVILCLAFIVRVANGEPAPGDAGASSKSNRVSVAVLRFENAAGDPALDFWGYAADTVFRNCLHEIRAVRSLPDSTLDYGLREARLKPGESISAEQARQLGEIIEAQDVVTGSYTLDPTGGWRLNLRVVNVASGHIATNVAIAATNWFEIRDKAAGPLLTALGAQASPAELGEMSRHWTKSGAALEWITRGRDAFKQKRPAKEWERCAERAVEADPDCAEGYVLLGASLGTQGKFSASASALRKAIKLDPKSARAYSGLGSLAMLSEKLDEAGAPLTNALRLNPDNADAWARLGELAMIEKRLPEAVEHLNKAVRLSPYQASLHGNLARARVLQGKRAAALRELAAAEQLVSDGDVNAETYLAWSYARLNNAPDAIAHYEKLVATARKLGLNPKRVDDYQKELRQLQQALRPAYVKVPAPPEYSAEEFEKALRARLSPAEYAGITNPLAATPELIARARAITSGANDDTQKARLLFEALAGHLDSGDAATRTAAESFAAWSGPATTYLRCQEYARLYVALARAVGLRAFFVDVTVAYDGERVSHSCAAVFLDGKTLLVDPSYQWFGVPHQKFQIFDDIEATSEYLHQQADLPRLDLAVKLAPNSAIAHYNRGIALLQSKQPENARLELNRLITLDHEGSYTNALAAALALRDQQPAEAAAFSREALKTWPAGDGTLYVALGAACWRQGQFAEARDAFRAALQHSLSATNAAEARRALAQINERIGTD